MSLNNTLVYNHTYIKHFGSFKFFEIQLASWFLKMMLLQILI